MAIIPSLPVTLQNGTTADATQVMADFNAIVSAVNANSANAGINTNITQLLGLTVAVGVAQGGTGQQILTPNGVLIGEGTTGINAVAPGAAGTVLTSNGPGLDPTYQASVPSGSMLFWPTATAPTGWIEANGQSTGPYINLPPIFGANVPDMRGQFIRGWDHSAGVDPGRTLLSAQGDQFQTHTHALTDPGHVHVINVATSSFICSGSGANFALTSFGATSQSATTGITINAPNSGNTGSETRPKNVAWMCIIKT